MNYEKGKGRAAPGDSPAEASHANSKPDSKAKVPSSSAGDNSSLFSRVANSASGLARSTFIAPPSATEVRNQATTSLASAGKSGPSNATSSTSNESSSIARPGQSQVSAPSFRTQRDGDQQAHSEYEFSTFLDGVSPLDYSGDNVTGLEDRAARPLSPSSEMQGFGGSYGRGHSQSSQNHSSIPDQQARDGDAVVALLSDEYHSQNEAFEPPLPEEVDWNLSPDQLVILRSITRELFPPSPEDPHAPLDPRHSLNLNPFSDGQYDVAMNGTESLFGADVPLPEARQMWLDRWEAVLNRYQDEVWGDLLPIVRDAKEEIALLKEDGHGEQMVNGEGSTQTKALRRLGMILGHLGK